MEYREFRAGSVDEGDDGKLILRAAPFNSEIVIGDLKRGGWKEEIAPGCFTKALREGDTLLLADHDMTKPISRMSAGTLRLTEGETHLEGDADPTDTSYYRDLRANIKSGNKGGMSIGFQPVKDDWFDDEGKPSNRMTGTRRVLREVKLPEVSIVTNPAYKDTAVFARDDSTALFEERAAAVKEADRKALASKGHALKDGSYPIPDIAHLHAAAILAASHHGDWQAAQELIRKRAPELGVDVNSLPGFNETAKGSRSEGRDDPDGHEYEAIDAALRQLKAGDVKGAEKTLAANQAARSQEPGSSTPEDDEDDSALLDSELKRQWSSRELGYVKA